MGRYRWGSSKRANAAEESSRGAGGGGRSTYFPISFGQEHGEEDGGDAASFDDLAVAGDGVDVEGQDWKGDEVEVEDEVEGEEESQSEQADRLRAVWEEKKNKLAPLRRQGLRKGDEIYDFALGKAEEAESAWRAIRGPMPRETRRRKALEAIQRWEARCLKLQGEVDNAEAQLEGLRAELQEGSAKLEAAKQTAADIRREEAGEAEETANWYAEDYASGQTREAIHDAADHVESVGAELAATAENWADGTPGKEKLCELLAHMEAAAAALDKAKCLESKTVRHNLSDHEEGDSSGDDGSRSGGEGAMDWGEGSWTDQQWAEWRDQQARMQQQLQQDRAREEERERFAKLQQDHIALQGQLEQARMCQQRVQEGDDARRAEELRAQQAKLEELQRTGRHQELAMALASCEAEAGRTTARADARDEREADAEKQQAGDGNEL